MTNQPDNASLAAHTRANAKSRRGLRHTSFGAIVLLIVQAGIGMAVNLYVIVPAHHEGADPSNFFGGSIKSVGWAISHDAIILAIHAVLGLLLVIFVVEVAYRATKHTRGLVTTWAILAGLFVIGAGFKGASFLDFNKAISSLLMALLTFAAIVCYCAILFLSSSAVND
jgi:heme A synthase